MPPFLLNPAFCQLSIFPDNSTPGFFKYVFGDLLLPLNKGLEGGSHYDRCSFGSFSFLHTMKFSMTSCLFGLTQRNFLFAIVYYSIVSQSFYLSQCYVEGMKNSLDIPRHIMTIIVVYMLLTASRVW